MLRLLVLATPTYKASYTGLLKLFLDVFPAGSLSSTVVMPLIVSGGPAHRHLGDLQLRPVLSELGAVCRRRRCWWRSQNCRSSTS